MEITNCPECAAETISGGLALWDSADRFGADEPMVVFECVGEDCGWVGVAVEYWAELSPSVATAA
jgi:hypothetical protein